MKKYIILCLTLSILSLPVVARKNTVAYATEQRADDIKKLFAEEQYYDLIGKYAQKEREKMTNDELLYVGWSLYMLNESGRAEKYIEDLLKRQPKNAMAHYVHALIDISENKIDDGLNSILKAIELDSLQGKFYTEAANIYRDKEKTDTAIDYYKKGISAKNPSEQAYFMLADIYDYIGKHGEALKTFYDAKEHVKRDQELYATILYNIGTMEMDAKNYRNAIVAYNELVVYFPDDYLTYTRLIQCCYALGDYEVGNTYKEVLFDAYANGLLTDGEFSEMFCIDNFTVGDKGVSAYEFFQTAGTEDPRKETPIYVFYVINAKGMIEAEIKYSLMNDSADETPYVLTIFRTDKGEKRKAEFGKDMNYPDLKEYIAKGVKENYIFSFKLTPIK